MRKRQNALLLAWGLFSLAAGAVAGEALPKTAAQAIQESLKPAPDAASRSGAKTTTPKTHAAPKASRAHVKPILLLDEKNLGLGCAQP